MSDEPRHRPINRAFAREIARTSGCTGDLDDAAATELALILEQKLRSTILLALKLQRRARRTTLSCADIRDAAGPDGGLDTTSEPWAEILSRVPGVGRHRVARFGEPSSRIVPVGSASRSGPLPRPPADFSVRVHWLAVDGFALSGHERLPSTGGRNGCQGSGGVMTNGTPPLGSRLCGSSSSSRRGNGLSAASPASWASGPLDHWLPALSEEQLAAVRRVMDVLCGGPDTAKWRSAAVALCGKEHFAAMRPVLAHLLARQVPAGIASASPREIHPLLSALEALALHTPKGGEHGAELYVHQCLPPLILLCMSPALGLQNTAMFCAGFGTIRRRAAMILGSVVRRYADSIPELYAEVCLTLERALRGRPPLATTTGAVQALTALGPACVRGVLLPLLLEGGLVDHIASGALDSARQLQAVSCGTQRPPGGANGATASLGDDLLAEFDGHRENDGPPRKKSRLRPGIAVEEGRADAFRALVGTSLAIAAPAEHGDRTPAERPGGTVCRAAELCERAAAAFGTDPAPLLAALPVDPAGILQPAPAALPRRQQSFIATPGPMRSKAVSPRPSPYNVPISYVLGSCVL